ncbi:MAG: hypothetical protein R6W82_03035 [bacterium]
MSEADPPDIPHPPEDEVGADRGRLAPLRRPGFWAVLLGVATAVMGAVMMKDFDSPVWMVLLFAGLVVFAFGLVLSQRD